MYTINVELYKCSILLLVTMGLSAPQYPMLYGPMFPPPPPPPPPPQPLMQVQVPVPVPVPLSIPIPIPVLVEMKINSTTDTTSTTSTTTEKPKMNLRTFFFPLSMPLPFPMGIAAPPPVIMIPFPPARIYRLEPSSASNENSKSSSSDSDDSSDSDSDSSSREKKRRKKKRYGIYRRHYRRANDDSTEEELKPVLNFISRNGDIKLRRHVSKQDAALLIQNELSPHPVQTVHVMVGDDSKEKSRVKVVAESANPPYEIDQEKKQIVMRRSAQQIVNSNKQLVFKPPNNKKISNISISFNVAR